MGNSSSGVDVNSEEAKFVQSEIENNCVVIFSKSHCPHCRVCKNTFQKLGVDYKVIELDYRSDGNAIQDILHQMTGARTVSIFLHTDFIKGTYYAQSAPDMMLVWTKKCWAQLFKASLA